MKAIIISAFPGMGKTYARSFSQFNIKDLDSSNYKWIEDAKKGRLQNPDFPNNYIEAISKAQNEEDVDFVFVSSHSEIREYLSKAKIQYILISPKQNIREELCARYKERGNSEKFIKKIHDNWYNYTGSMLNETWPIQIKFGAEDFIDENLLKLLKENSEQIYNKTLNNVKSKNLESNLAKYDVFWSILSKDRKGWTSSELRKYKEFIDWDALCKFNILPEDILKDESFKKYINMDYVKANIKKYSPKVRKLLK